MPFLEKDREKKAYGCFFCRSGCERQIAQELERQYPEMTTNVPSKLRYRRSRGMAQEEEAILFPGYLFFCAAPEFAAFEVRHRYVYRVLCDGENDWRTEGADKAFIELLFEQHGPIGFSKACYEGDRIKILDGFLKEYEGQIIRVNRRAKTAEVKVNFREKEMHVWLGFELIE